MDQSQLSTIFKALGDENRLRILHQLRSGEKCACKLLEALSIGQPTLSHHMKVLCDAGLVISRKEGKWMYYSICCEGVCDLREILRALLSPDYLPQDCSCAEGCSNQE